MRQQGMYEQQWQQFQQLQQQQQGGVGEDWDGSESSGEEGDYQDYSDAEEFRTAEEEEDWRVIQQQQQQFQQLNRMLQASGHGIAQPPLMHGPERFGYPVRVGQPPLIHGPDGFLYPPGAAVPGWGGAAAGGLLPRQAGGFPLPLPPTDLELRQLLAIQQAQPEPVYPEVSNDTRILIERMQPNNHLAMNGNPLPQQLMQQGGSVLPGAQLQQQPARAAGMLVMDGTSAVSGGGCWGCCTVLCWTAVVHLVAMLCMTYGRRLEGRVGV
jgi:hypothetical protein